MVRVTRGNCASKRRKKILNLATGFNGAHSSSYRSANSQVMKKLVYSYNSSRERKRKFRSLWICRINGMLKHEKVSYSGFMERAKKFNIKLDLKMISELCRLKNLNPFLTMKMIKHIN